METGDKIPRKGGPGITRSDLNKIDLAPLVGAEIAEFIRQTGGLDQPKTSAHMIHQAER